MNWNDNWNNGENTHDDIEAAIKAKVQEILTRIANGETTVEQAQQQLVNLQQSVASMVPNTRTINGKRLNANVTLQASDVHALPDTTVIPDASNFVQKDGEKGLSTNDYTDADKAKVAASQSAQQVASAIQQAIAGLPTGDQVSVIQPATPDGTFIIRVGSTDYTINLNHTHENMAKIVKCTEATLPQTLACDTIYVQVDNATTPTEIESLYLFGLEFTGGGLPAGTPQLTKPKNGVTIDMGNTVNGSVSKVIPIKGKNLTQPLVVELGNGSTGYSFDTSNLPTGVTYDSNTGKLTIAAANACSVNGVEITVIYTGSAYEAAGVLGISSSSVDGVNVECNLIANADVWEELAGVKFNGAQWVQTDYYPNANTEFEMEVRFETNANTNNPSAATVFLQSGLPGDNNRLDLNNASPANELPQYNIIFHSNDNNIFIVLSSQTTETLVDHAIIKYTKNASQGKISFMGTTLHEETTPLKTGTCAYPWRIAHHRDTNLIYNVFDLTIYRFTIKEGGTNVRNYVARKHNGVAGLYDTVTNVFITSETSTELVAIPTSNS